MEFPSILGDIITIRVDQRTIRECYATSLRIESLSLNQNSSQSGKDNTIVMIDFDPRINNIQVELDEDTTPLHINDEG